MSFILLPLRFTETLFIQTEKAAKPDEHRDELGIPEESTLLEFEEGEIVSETENGANLVKVKETSNLEKGTSKNQNENLAVTLLPTFQERPYMCLVCKKCFAKPTELRRHYELLHRTAFLPYVDVTIAFDQIIFINFLYIGLKIFHSHRYRNPIIHLCYLSKAI